MNALMIAKNSIRFTKNDVKTLLKRALPYLLAVACLVACMMMMCCFAEDDTTTAKDAFTAIMRIVKLIVTAVGALFILIGVVKFTIAHAQEDSPSQQKSAMMLASGVALVLLPAILDALHLETMIKVDATTTE